MMRYFIHTPLWLKCIFRGLYWPKAKANKKVIYLSFDDGPHPEVSTQILDILEQFQAKATFFCLGEAAENHPSILQKIRQAGHSIGGHGYQHLDGWKTSNDLYLENTHKAQKLLQTKLFRPAYGRLGIRQYLNLSKRYNIVLWDCMPGDFDSSISQEDCLKNALAGLNKDSIFVLHDNKKSWPHLEYMLPRLLAYARQAGYCFDTL